MPRLDRVTRTFWRLTGRPVDLDETGGLLADLSCLDGPGFSAADLRPEVRHF